MASAAPRSPQHQPDQIFFLGQQRGLEPVQGRGQCCASVPDLLRTDESERRVGGQSFGEVRRWSSN